MVTATTTKATPTSMLIRVGCHSHADLPLRSAHDIAEEARHRLLHQMRRLSLVTIYSNITYRCDRRRDDAKVTRRGGNGESPQLRWLPPRRLRLGRRHRSRLGQLRRRAPSHASAVSIKTAVRLPQTSRCPQGAMPREQAKVRPRPPTPISLSDSAQAALEVPGPGVGDVGYGQQVEPNLIRSIRNQRRSRSSTNCRAAFYGARCAVSDSNSEIVS
jgi:hypothetical protein